jgi:hypothetical protein
VLGRLFSEEQKAAGERVLFEKGGGCQFCHIEKQREKKD